MLEATRGVSNTHRQRRLAEAAGVSLSEFSAVLLGKRNPNPATLVKLYVAASTLQEAEREKVEQTKGMLTEVQRHCHLTSLRDFARRAGIDPANLARVMKGRSKPSSVMLARLESALIRASEHRSEFG